MRRTWLLVIALVAGYGAGHAARPHLEVATWNLEWFDSGPRGPSGKSGKRAWPTAYQTIAQILRGEGVAAGDPDLEAVGIEEVTDTKYVAAVVRFLPGWQYLVLPARGGTQRCALLWNAAQVRVQALPPLTLVAGKRQALHARLAAGALAFDYVVCHLQSGASREARVTREAQCRALTGWLHGQDRASPPTDPDVLIGGDLNAEADEPALQTLLSDPWLTWCFAGWSRLLPTRPSSGRTLDHLFYTPALRPRVAGVAVLQSAYQRLGEAQYRGLVSDHLPVMVSLYTD
jgi:endonuclease/exonuclease/phosphatase family metal-dependent hydrolase